MSIEQQQQAVSAETSSAIENEIPAYRAISPAAVVALIFGTLSILAFTDFWFLILTGLSIITGVYAVRKIDRMPEILTGKKFAQAGMALGLVFGLTSVTTSTVLYYLKANQAKIFAMQMQDVLNRGTVEDGMFYHQPPSNRKNSSPEKMMESMAKGGRDAQATEMQYAPLKELKKAIALKDSDFHFEEIENVSDDGVVTYAAAVYEVHAPNNPAPLPKEGYAVALFKGMKTKGKYEWWIEEIRYPYKREGVVITPKAVDDGHGHGGH